MGRNGAPSIELRILGPEGRKEARRVHAKLHKHAKFAVQFTPEEGAAILAKAEREGYRAAGSYIAALVRRDLLLNP